MPCHTEPDPAERRRYAEQLKHNADGARLLCSLLRTGQRTPEHDAWFVAHRNMDKDRAIRDAAHQLARAHHVYENNPTVPNHEARRVLLERLDRLKDSDPMTTDLY